MAKVKFDVKDLNRRFKNALNRTLTKVKRIQKNYLINEKHLKPSVFKSYRWWGIRASQKDLSISIKASKKQITPSMILTAYRPFRQGFGWQKRRDGNKPSFFISYKPRKVSGWTTAQGGIITSKTRNGRSKPRRYWYLARNERFDIAAMEFTEKLNKRAIDILNEEFKK